MRSDGARKEFETFVLLFFFPFDRVLAWIGSKESPGREKIRHSDAFFLTTRTRFLYYFFIISVRLVHQSSVASSDVSVPFGMTKKRSRNDDEDTTGLKQLCRRWMSPPHDKRFLRHHVSRSIRVPVTAGHRLSARDLPNWSRFHVHGRTRPPDRCSRRACW